VSEREELRPLLFSLAYRMLGSVAEAEDVVQESFLRLERARVEGVEVESPKAYLTTVATRIAIDQLRSARRRREQYVGPWLPEPLLVDPDPGPAEAAELADSLSLAFLVVLETLSPLERAVFVLREVFDYGYAEIGEALGRSEESCRQLAARARRHMDERRPRYEVSREEREALAARFFAAFEHGDADELVAVLAPDVVLTGDGGGKAPALPQPLFGRERVVKALVGFARHGTRVHAALAAVAVNGQPGAIVSDADGRVVAAIALEISDGAVVGVKSVVNPEKLRHLGEPADLRALLRGDRTGWD
jgi:RNA polymerase sigma-70 factor, ECF subfamily